MNNATRQQQKSGDNSMQIQSGVTNINLAVTGITEDRARAIADEQFEKNLRTYSMEARAIATQRNMDFQNELISKAINAQTLGMFADPDSLLALKKAQEQAITTDNKTDYELLSDLLIRRFQQDKRIPRLGITKAIEVIGQISEEALQGLTMFYAVQYIQPVVKDIESGLHMLDNTYSHICNGSPLPCGEEWIDHLAILDTIRITSFSTSSTLADTLFTALEGLSLRGIKKESEQHAKATELLKGAGLDAAFFLIENPTDNEYVRLAVGNRHSITNDFMFVSSSGNVKYRMTDHAVDALQKVYDIYAADKMMNTETFSKSLKKYPSIQTAAEWWDNEVYRHRAIELTSIGETLALVNGKRLDSTFPVLD